MGKIKIFLSIILIFFIVFVLRNGLYHIYRFIVKNPLIYKLLIKTIFFIILIIFIFYLVYYILFYFKKIFNSQKDNIKK